jgi:hypothetical protein
MGEAAVAAARTIPDKRRSTFIRPLLETKPARAPSGGGLADDAEADRGLLLIIIVERWSRVASKELLLMSEIRSVVVVHTYVGMVGVY